MAGASAALTASSRASTSSGVAPRTSTNCAGLGVPSRRPVRRCASISAGGELCSWRTSSTIRSCQIPGTINRASAPSASAVRRSARTRGQRARLSASQFDTRVGRSAPRSSSGNQSTTVRKAATSPTAENSAIWRSPGNGAMPSARYATTLVASASAMPGSRWRMTDGGVARGSACRETK
ncbi:hypothetical protein D3C72_1378080 [compost metagenome]